MVAPLPQTGLRTVAVPSVGTGMCRSDAPSPLPPLLPSIHPLFLRVLNACFQSPEGKTFLRPSLADSGAAGSRPGTPQRSSS